MYEGSASIQYDYYCGLSQLMSCASAPSILGLNHLLEGKKASCYPGFEEDLLEAKVSYDPVSKDGNIITSLLIYLISYIPYFLLFFYYIDQNHQNIVEKYVLFLILRGMLLRFYSCHVSFKFS